MVGKIGHSSESSGASSDLESLFWPTRKKSKGKEAKPKPSDEQVVVQDQFICRFKA
jgi:hypothetical protein